MQNINHGVQAGGNVSYQNSNVSFNAGQGSNTLEDECLRSLAIGTVEAREDLPERTPHTGKWILSHPTYCSWREEGGLLWIQGRPGTGKTMLLDFLTEIERQRCSPQDTTVLSFFFEHSARAAERHDLKITMFRSLCYQMIRTNSNLLSHFMSYTNFAGKSQISKNAGVRCAWKGHELRSWLSVATRELLPKGHSILVFLDALNEMGPGPATESAEQLRAMVVEHIGDFGVCISCHVRLMDGSKLDLNHDHVIRCEDENKDDVKMYVDARLKRSLDLTESPELHVVKADLIEGANGVFQWLKWTTEKVRTLMEAGEDASHIVQHMRKYPRQLDAVYEQMLGNLDDEELERAYHLFECLALANGAMLAEDLRRAVCLDERANYRSLKELEHSPEYCDSDVLLMHRAERFSRGLIRSSSVKNAKIRPWPFEEGHFYRLHGIEIPSFYNPGPQMVKVLRFDHDSVRDFMLTRGLNMLEDRRDIPAPLSIPERHGRMAMKLVAFFQADEVVTFANSRQLRIESEFFGVRSFIYPKPIEEPDLMQYAVTHWHAHASAAEEDVSTLSWMIDRILTLGKQSWSDLARLHETAALCMSSQFCMESSLIHILSLCGLERMLSAMLKDGREEEGVSSSLARFIEAKHKGGRTPLFLAAQAGKFGCARLLVEHRANVNSRSVQGMTALHVAALNGHIDVLRLLLAQPGIDVDASDQLNHTSLRYAVQASNLAAIKVLMPRSQKGVHSPASTDFYSFGDWPLGTPLALAFQTGSVEVLKFLLNSFGPGDMAQLRGRNSLLHNISEYRYECLNDFGEKADVTIKSGIFDINWIGRKGQTPLFVAAEHGAHEVVRLLLQRADVKVDEANDDGVTPSICAVRQDDRKIAKMLLESGKVDVNRLVRNSTETPLLIAVRHRARDIVLELLKHCDIQPDLADCDGRTPILEAVISQNAEITWALARTGQVDRNIRDAGWNPAIHLAIDSDNYQMITALLQAPGARVDLTATDALGFPPLLRAARRGKFAMVMGLLMKGQMHVVDSLGAIPLMVSFARDEYEKDPASQEREAILVLLEGLDSKNSFAQSEPYRAV